jgi:hypothetical protein
MIYSWKSYDIFGSKDSQSIKELSEYMMNYVIFGTE